MSAPRPRLCHLRLIPRFDGYGFSLRDSSDGSCHGHVVCSVEDLGPAALTGIREGDRVIEVNGINVVNENHQQVVQRIKSVEGETRILVVDNETEEYYKQKRVVISGDMLNIWTLHTPTDIAAFKPRLCHLRNWSDFSGYGFNLVNESGKQFAFVAKVETGSPAELAGLRGRDKIIEVNGRSARNFSHEQVIDMIRSDPDKVVLLVASPQCTEYFRSREMEISSTHPAVEKIYCPAKNPNADQTKNKPRLCHIRSASDGSGFGFNLLSDKSTYDSFIGSVDLNSPAMKAGLMRGDRIIEVNGENVEKCGHDVVVQKMKRFQDEMDLLVVDEDSDEFYCNQLPPGYRQSSTDTGNGVFRAYPEANGTGPAQTTTSRHSTGNIVIGGVEFAGSVEEARRRVSRAKSVKDSNMSMQQKYAVYKKL